MKKHTFCCVVGIGFLLCGCASTSQSSDVYDPLEPVNRQIFAFNHSLDKHAALPAASYYKNAVPGEMREGLHNFLTNLGEPVTFANDVLQGETTRAGESICRFGVNMTVGVLGVLDPATGMGCPEHNEDFGLTLGVYGVPGGPYLMLPLLGSTFPRDIVGKIFVDHYFNPLGYLAYRGKLYVSLSESLLKTVDQRSRALPMLNDVERNSIDYYATIRSLYKQKRDSEIWGSDATPATAAQ